MDSPDCLRRHIRALRRALPAVERQRAAQAMARRVGALEAFASARRIAGYLAVDGEMDPAPLLEQARAMGRQVFLPVLAGNSRFHLLFAPYHPDSPMKPNRFGIPEPDVADDQLLAPQRLDLALTPLVAFDASGSRLGMGGGFYDRTFAYRRQPGCLPRPRLLGLAYELQKVPLLKRQPWDVPLDGIVTEAAVYPGDSGLLP